MAKLAVGGSAASKRKGVASPASAEPSVSGVEQLRAAYVVLPSPRLAAGAWVAYRDQFLNSSAQAQISEIRKGAPASNLVGAAEALHLPRERVYELVGLSASTAKRKLAKDEMLDPLMTERLTRLGAIERLAEDTFGDALLASEWLQTLNLGLGNVTPLSMLDTEIGCREVSRVLNAIAYGGAA
jgi:putative toxin-antitoxin system antitoxin component (TIGR02293 family)